MLDHSKTKNIEDMLDLLEDYNDKGEEKFHNSFDSGEDIFSHAD